MVVAFDLWRTARRDRPCFNVFLVSRVDLIAPLPRLSVQILPTAEGAPRQKVILDEMEGALHASRTVGIANGVRHEVLSAVARERLDVELMAQRPRQPSDVLNSALLETVLKRLSELETKAAKLDHVDDLKDLMDDAGAQGRFRAYLCPVTEIQDEGDMLLDLVEGWGVPKASVKKLRDTFAKRLRDAETTPDAARSALRVLFQERDDWSDYADDYEDTMQGYTRWLFGASIILPALAAIAFNFAFRFSPVLLFGLLLAGAAGSCVSVMGKMPAMDVSLAGELDAYGRRVLSRIGTGVVASLIGSAMLGWLPLSVQNQTFADALNACVTGPATGIKALLLIGVPMLLGFSERTLTSFEQRVFGSPEKTQRGGTVVRKG